MCGLLKISCRVMGRRLWVMERVFLRRFLGGIWRGRNEVYSRVGKGERKEVGVGYWVGGFRVGR